MSSMSSVSFMLQEGKRKKRVESRRIKVWVYRFFGSRPSAEVPDPKLVERLRLLLFTQDQAHKLVRYRAIYSTSPLTPQAYRDHEADDEYQEAYNLLQDMIDNFTFPLTEDNIKCWVYGQIQRSDFVEATGGGNSGILAMSVEYALVRFAYLRLEPTAKVDDIKNFLLDVWLPPLDTETAIDQYLITLGDSDSLTQNPSEDSVATQSSTPGESETGLSGPHKGSQSGSLPGERSISYALPAPGQDNDSSIDVPAHQLPLPIRLRPRSQPTSPRTRKHARSVSPDNDKRSRPFFKGSEEKEEPDLSQSQVFHFRPNFQENSLTWVAYLQASHPSIPSTDESAVHPPSAPWYSRSVSSPLRGKTSVAATGSAQAVCNVPSQQPGSPSMKSEDP
jgi:hypothetical protein